MAVNVDDIREANAYFDAAMANLPSVVTSSLSAHNAAVKDEMARALAERMTVPGGSMMPLEAFTKDSAKYPEINKPVASQIDEIYNRLLDTDQKATENFRAALDGYQRVFINAMGADAYAAKSRELGADFASAYVCQRYSDRLYAELGRQQAPKSTMEYFLQTFDNTTLLPFSGRSERSAESDKLAAAREAAYKPSKNEYVGSRVATNVIDAIPELPVFAAGAAISPMLFLSYLTVDGLFSAAVHSGKLSAIPFDFLKGYDPNVSLTSVEKNTTAAFADMVFSNDADKKAFIENSPSSQPTEVATKGKGNGRGSASKWSTASVSSSPDTNNSKTNNNTNMANNENFQLSKLGSNLWVTSEQRQVMESLAEKYHFSDYGYGAGSPLTSLVTAGADYPIQLSSKMSEEDRKAYEAAYDEAYSQSTVERANKSERVWIKDQVDAEIHYSLPSASACQTDDEKRVYYMMLAHATNAKLTVKSLPGESFTPQDPRYKELRDLILNPQSAPTAAAAAGQQGQYSTMSVAADPQGAAVDGAAQGPGPVEGQAVDGTAVPGQTTNTGGWAGSLFDGFVGGLDQVGIGSEFMSQLMNNPGQALADMPEALFGSKKSGLLPIFMMLIGMNIKNPLLKLILMAGSLGMLYKNYKINQEEKSAALDTSEERSPQRVTYRNEDLHQDIRSADLRGNVLFLETANGSMAVTLKDNVVEAVKAGNVPVNVLANKVYDQYLMSSQNFESQYQSQQQGQSLIMGY